MNKWLVAYIFFTVITVAVTACSSKRPEPVAEAPAAPVADTVAQANVATATQTDTSSNANLGAASSGVGR